MKACPNCYLSFNDGYICPHCGGQLVDYNPDQQAQSSYQSSYYDQPQQASQPTQVMQAPAPAPAPQAHYQQPAAQYHQPVNNFPPTIIKKRTGLVVFLFLLVIALGAFGGYLVYKDYQEATQPSDLETSVVKSAWTWYTALDGMFTVMEESQQAAQGQTAENPYDRGANKSTGASGASGASGDSGSAGDASASGGESGAGDTAGAEGESAMDGENTAAVASSPTSSPTSAEDAAAVHNSDVVSDDGAAGSGEGAAGSTSPTSADQEVASITESMGELGESIGQSLAAAMGIAILASPDYLDTVDAPMQALKEKYPDLVSSWDGIKSALASPMENEAQMIMVGQQVRQAGESFKRTAEKEGFAL